MLFQGVATNLIVSLTSVITAYLLRIAMNIDSQDRQKEFPPSEKKNMYKILLTQAAVQALGCIYALGQLSISITEK